VQTGKRCPLTASQCLSIRLSNGRRNFFAVLIPKAYKNSAGKAAFNFFVTAVAV